MNTNTNWLTILFRRYWVGLKKISPILSWDDVKDGLHSLCTFCIYILSVAFMLASFLHIVFLGFYVHGGDNPFSKPDPIFTSWAHNPWNTPFTILIVAVNLPQWIRTIRETKNERKSGKSLFKSICFALDKKVYDTGSTIVTHRAQAYAFATFSTFLIIGALALALQMGLIILKTPIYIVKALRTLPKAILQNNQAFLDNNPKEAARFEAKKLHETLPLSHQESNKARL